MIATLSFSFLPLVVGLMASRRRRPARIRLRILGEFRQFMGRREQVVHMQIVDRNGHCLNRMMMIIGEGHDQHALKMMLRKLRTDWRDTVLPKDWRARSAARSLRTASVAWRNR